MENNKTDFLKTLSNEFEREITGHPQDSAIWIRYASTLIKLNLFSHAALIFERAIKELDTKLEQHHFNLWISYLRFSLFYISFQHFNKLFQRALSLNDPHKLYLTVGSFFVDDTEIFLKFFDPALKKYKMHFEIWDFYISFLMRNKQFQKAKSAYNKSIQLLDRANIFKISLKMAQLEYKYGNKEHGRSMFEKLLAENPKRLDAWLVYSTSEEIFFNQTQNDYQYIQRLYQKIISLRLSDKKAKFFFKKYLDFEKKFGDTSSIEKVKNLAKKFVQQY